MLPLHGRFACGWVSRGNSLKQYLEGWKSNCDGQRDKLSCRAVAVKPLKSPGGSLKRACTLRTSPLRKRCAATVLHHFIASSGAVVPEGRHSLMRASSLQPSCSWGGPQAWLEGSNGTWALDSRFLQTAAFYSDSILLA